MWCRIHQWMISSAADDDQPVGRMTRRHIAGCAECRQFQQITEHLGEHLRQNVFSAATPVRVFHAAGSAGGQRRLRIRPAAALAGGMALAAAIVLVAVQLFPTQTRSTPIERADRNARPDPTMNLPDPTSPLSLDFTGPVDVFADAAAAPVRQELENLTRDAQATAQTLAAYLPMGLGESNRRR